MTWSSICREGEVCLRLKLLGPEAHEAGKAMLDRIMGMLVKLAKSLGE